MVNVLTDLERITASLEIDEIINPVMVRAALEKMCVVLHFDGEQCRALETAKKPCTPQGRNFLFTTSLLSTAPKNIFWVRYQSLQNHYFPPVKSLPNGGKLSSSQRTQKGSLEHKEEPP
jgi:hypothetical protein